MEHRCLYRCLVGALMTCMSLALSAQETVTLSDGWAFRQERLRNWHPATVPGTVHTDLMALGSIEDPFFGMNERSVQWIVSSSHYLLKVNC